SPDDVIKQTLLSVVQVWLDRLQKQAVVTTFFVSIDSLLFSLTSNTRSDNLSGWSVRDEVINGSLGGAIIFHVCASIVAYIGSFVLIRYRLNDAERAEQKVIPRRCATPPRTTTRARVQPWASSTLQLNSSALGPTSPVDFSALTEAIASVPDQVNAELRGLVSVYRSHPLRYLCGCGRRSRAREDKSTAMQGPQPPTAIDTAIETLKDMVSTLERAHSVCAGMSSLGFLLALIGILTYAWTAVPIEISIFVSACLGCCGIAASIALW
ncbi:uncharacterized protein BXZ73DRAFT_41272, partial [Epithele typhae]|uniref:uncharacterized protein n=1 Tax=Epithele typhae TaxID=378194 RepID=UPI00200806FB